MAEAGVSRLEQDVEEIKLDVRRLAEGQARASERLARLEGGFEQMNQRIGELGGHMDHRIGEFGGHLDQRMGELGGHLDQRIGELGVNVDRRLSNVESGLRWVLGIVVSSWLTIGSAVVGLYLKG